VKRQPIPRRALRRLGDAGQSVYRWRDAELLKGVDPTGKLTTASDVTGMMTSWAAIAIAAGLVYSAGGLLPALAVAAILVVGTFLRPSLPWWPLAVLASSLGESSITWNIAAAAVALLVQGLSGRGAARAATLGWFALALAHPGIATGALAAGTLGLAAYRTYEAGLPIGPLTARHMRGKLAAPKPQLPWLVALVKRRELRNVPPEIARKTAGGYGERATALLLLGLPALKRTRIVHDVTLPGMDVANLDHVLLSRAGLFAIDSKVFRGEIAIEGNDLFRVHEGQRFSLRSAVEAAAWGATQLTQALETPATAVVIVHGATLRGAIQVAVPKTGNFVTVVSGADALAYFAQLPNLLDNPDLASLEMALAHLRAYDGGRAQILRPLGTLGVAHDPVPATTMTLAATSVRQQPERPTAHAVAPIEAHGMPAAPAAVEVLPASLEERWLALRAAATLAPDKLDDDGLAAVQAGVAVTVFGVEDGVLAEEHYIAVSGVLPAQGSKPARVAVSHESAWRVHVESGQAIGFSTVSADRVIVTPKESA